MFLIKYITSHPDRGHDGNEYMARYECQPCNNIYHSFRIKKEWFEKELTCSKCEPVNPPKNLNPYGFYSGGPIIFT